MARSQGWLSGNRLIAYFAVAVFVVLVGYMATARKQTGSDGEKLSGKEREDFVLASVRTCIDRQRSFPENKELTPATIEKYCECYVNGLADAFTVGELKHFVETKQSAAIKGRSDQVSRICVGRVQ